ncbi:MAG: hypothetical protein ACFE85_00980 [Candidatus Hodarchaeota archaeon]
MLNKYKKIVVITSIILISFVPIIEIAINCNSVSTDEIFSNNSYYPKSQALSMEDFTPIIENQNHGLGNVTITNVTFNEEGFFNYSLDYPNLDDDLTSGALEMSYNNTDYIETIKFAQSDNLNESLVYSNIITVVLNESIKVSYNTSIGGSEGFLIYKTSLASSQLIRFQFQNDSSSQLVDLVEGDYSIDTSKFIVFDYSNYFGVVSHNFTMHLIWEVNISLINWNIFQDNNEEIVVTLQEQELRPQFSYNFIVLAYKYNRTSVIGEIIAPNLEIDLKLYPLDRNQLKNHTLEVNEVVVTNFLDMNNNINATINAIPGLFRMNFTTNFTIRFENPMDYSWTIDRLVKNDNVRERIYIPTLLEGPDHIYLSQVVIFETSITINQVISNSSLFDRDVLNFDANLTVVEEHYQHSLIFTENSIRKKGLKIVIPYLIKGESNPFFITYNANNDLLVIVTDNIRMPVSNLNIEIYYYDKPYGTYISNDFVQPSAPIITDVNGKALLRNLITGNYTLKIYRKNVLIKETIINTFSEVHNIYTEILHFPIWIIIFGLISGIIFLIGFIIYLNSKRKQ